MSQLIQEEDDEVDDLQERINKRKEKGKDGPRASVSAEVFGDFNKKEDFKARVIPKSEEAKQKILAKLSGNFMFKDLSD